MKRKIKASKLIKKSKYPVTLNNDIKQEIEDYVENHGLSNETQSKLMILTSVIYTKQLKYKLFKAHISRNYFIKLFGPREYYILKTHALNCVIEKVTNHHQGAGIAASYRVKPKLFSGHPKVFYPNLNNRTLVKLDKAEEKDLRDAKEIETLHGDLRLTIQNNFLDRIKGVFQRPNRITKLTGQLRERGVLTSDAMYKQIALVEGFAAGLHITKKIDRNGRIYNFLSYIKKELRLALGRGWMQVDISSSHPYVSSRILHRLLFTDKKQVQRTYGFMSWITQLSNNLDMKLPTSHVPDSYKVAAKMNVELCNFLTTKALDLFDAAVMEGQTQTQHTICNSVTKISKDSLKSELVEIMELTGQGLFYENLVTKAESNGIDFLRLLYIVKDGVPGYKSYEKDDITNDLKRLIIKKSVLFWLYGKVSRDYYWRQTFLTAYPSLTLLLKIIKTHFDHRVFHHLITLAESNVIFKTVYQLHKNRSIITGTIHDSIVFPSKYLKLVKKMLEDEAARQLGSPPYLKIQLMEFDSLLEDFP